MLMGQYSNSLQGQCLCEITEQGIAVNATMIDTKTKEKKTSYAWYMSYVDL